MGVEPHWWDRQAAGKDVSLLRQRARELDGRLVPSIHARQREIYDKPETAAVMERFADDAENIAADVVGEVAQVYDSQPRRWIKNGTDEQNAAFREIVIESGIATKAEEWSRHTLYSGPVLVTPSVQRSDAGVALGLLSYRAHAWDKHPDTITGLYPPEVVARELDDDGNTLRLLAIDGEAWREYSGLGEEGRTTQHALGLPPVAIFRASDPQHDFWGQKLGTRAAAATLSAGIQWAELAYVRKAANTKTLAILVQDRDTPVGQTLSPELGLELSFDSRAEVLDLTVSPKDFLEHIDAIKAAAFRAYGVPTSDLKFMSERGIAVTLARRRLLRRAQAEYMAPAEARLWRVALGLVAGATEHRYSSLFANWRDLQIGVEFSEVSLTEDPKQREEVYQLRASRGASDPVREYRADHPEVSDEEARAAIDRAIQIQAEIAAFRAKRQAPNPANLIKKPPQQAGAIERGYQTEAQETGRIGGEASGESRSDQ